MEFKMEQISSKIPPLSASLAQLNKLNNPNILLMLLHKATFYNINNLAMGVLLTMPQEASQQEKEKRKWKKKSRQSQPRNFKKKEKQKKKKDKKSSVLEKFNLKKIKLEREQQMRQVTFHWCKRSS